MTNHRFAVAALIAGLGISGGAIAQTAAGAPAAVPPALLLTAPSAAETAATPTAPAAAAVAPTFNPHGLPIKVGTYKCELNRDVQIRTLTDDQQTAVIHWNKKDYTLRSVSALSGALRYEDLQSGLVWLVVVGKSMLLDIKAGKQLANECRT